MPIGPGSIIEHRQFQQLLGQVVLNVQHYIILSMETIADDLADYAEPMYNRWANTLSPFQSAQLIHTRTELYEVNGLDFGIFASEDPTAGTETGDPLPSFNAVKVQLVRQTRATRHGWKRFAGLVETQVQGNSLTTGALTEIQNQVAALYPVNFTLDSVEFPTTRSITFQPIIWGGNDPDFPEGRFSAIANTVVANTITTQVSRKVGRGS